MAIVGRSPIGELKPDEEKDENHEDATFPNSLPFHSSREQRSRDRVLEVSLCHSVIVNYITISRARLFYRLFLRG